MPDLARIKAKRWGPNFWGGPDQARTIFFWGGAPGTGRGEKIWPLLLSAEGQGGASGSKEKAPKL
jgi:hypothetical protein